MKIQPVAGPQAIQQTTTHNTDARARAINAFMGQQASAPSQAPQQAEHPVANPSSVSPEEMTAISPTIPEPNIDALQAIPKSTPEQPVAIKNPEEPKTEVDPETIKQFENLKRQERQMRLRAQQRERQLKEREIALKAKEEAFQQQSQSPQTKGFIPQDRLKQDPMSVLAEAGVSYDDLVQQIINQKPEDPRLNAQLSGLKAEIQALKDQAEQYRKLQIEQQDQSYKAAVNQIRMDVKNLVTQDPEFETIKVTNSINDVVQLIEEVYKKDGILMTVEEASREVENYLVDEALKLTKIQKLQKKLQPNVTPKQPQSVPPKQPQPMKTLTNAASSGRKLSARERAILAFKGELK